MRLVFSRAFADFFHRRSVAVRAEILAFFCANFITGVYPTTGINSLSTNFGSKATSLENKPDLSKLVEKQPVQDMAEMVGAPHTCGTDDAHAVQDQKSVSEAVETTIVNSDGNHKRYLTLCCCCCCCFPPPRFSFASVFLLVSARALLSDC